ncbi:hypothetical protein H1C71_003664 [Ictidomys tridecemlineatus]|nr:hypothetical protein H1C71_003664 [Ictidomys tridecemlineatus]
MGPPRGKIQDFAEDPERFRHQKQNMCQVSVLSLFSRLQLKDPTSTILEEEEFLWGFTVSEVSVNRQQIPFLGAQDEAGHHGSRVGQSKAAQIMISKQRHSIQQIKSKPYL